MTHQHDDLDLDGGIEAGISSHKVDTPHELILSLFYQSLEHQQI